MDQLNATTGDFSSEMLCRSFVGNSQTSATLVSHLSAELAADLILTPLFFPP